MPKTIQLSTPANLLPDGISEADIFLTLGLPLETPTSFPEIHSYVLSLALAACDTVENLTGLDFRSRQYKTEVDNAADLTVNLKPNINPATFSIKDQDNNTIASTYYELDDKVGTVTVNYPYGSTLAIYWTTLDATVPSGLVGVILSLTSAMYNNRSSMPVLNEQTQYFLRSFRNPRLVI